MFPLILLLSCSTAGPVKTKFNHAYWKSRESSRPQGFQSHYNIFKKIISDLDEASDLESLKIASILRRETLKQLGELENSGELRLSPGKSYEFNLQSFCIHGGEERGLKGDGAYPGKLDLKSRSWLPKILKSYHIKQISREDTQTLIWGLLSGSRFGNRFIENQFKNFANDFLPSEVQKVIGQYKSLKDSFREYQSDYRELESIFAPSSSRAKVVEPVWVLTEDGYYI